MSLCLYMNHHVDAAITMGLRRRGMDVLTAFEDGAARLADHEILARCTEHGSVLFMLDHDFLEIAAEWQANQRRFTGIVFGRDPALSIGDAVNDLELIVEALSSHELESRVIWIPL
jgi:Domain of unknown function (DUF5615)